MVERLQRTEEALEQERTLNQELTSALDEAQAAHENDLEEAIRTQQTNAATELEIFTTELESVCVLYHTFSLSRLRSELQIHACVYSSLCPIGAADSPKHVRVSDEDEDGVRGRKGARIGHFLRSGEARKG